MSEQPAPRPSSSGKLKLVGLVVGIVVIEAIAAFFLLPSAASAPPAEEAPAAHAPAAHPEEEKKSGHSGGEKKGAEHGGEHGEVGEEAEVDLGKFTVTSFQPSSNSTLMIDFHLFGTVAGVDKAVFDGAYEENKHRVRDQVIIIIRGSEMADLTDAGLGLLKRRILEKTNDILGRPLLRTVVFSEFAFMEQ